MVGMTVVKRDLYPNAVRSTLGIIYIPGMCVGVDSLRNHVIQIERITT
jgi:hypothetical protein